MHPFPTVEQAYAHVRKEDQRQMVMMTRDESVSSMAMYSKGGKKLQQHISLKPLDHEKPGSLGKDRQKPEAAPIVET